MADVKLTPSEQLLYTTVKIVTMREGITQASGTGFFYRVNLGGEKASVLLVTNRHVLNGADEVIAICHQAEGNTPRPSGKFVRLSIKIGPDGIVDHPSPDVDLCALAFQSVINDAHANGTPLFLTTISSTNIPTAKDWENFDAIEPVTMVGCPRGIFDEANNLPIFRRGATASALGKRYNGKHEFLVDMACFPGSSGSPVFLLDHNGHIDREQNTFLLGVNRLFFLGVLYSGPIVTNTGKIVMTATPQVEVGTMMHLGYVLRSTQVEVLGEILRKQLSGAQEPEGA